MVPDLLGGVFPYNMYGQSEYIWRTFELMAQILSWDIVKGGLSFVLGTGIALFAVRKIREAFGV
jgi:hypothetical protein